MIFNPLFTTNNEPDDRTDELPRSGHLSRKDLRVLGVALVVFGSILGIVYYYMKRDAERKICRTNMSAVFKAISLYAIDNDNQLPPTHQMVPGTDEPVVENGAAITWVTSVSQYMDPKRNFVCPSAAPEEYAFNQGYSETKGTYSIPSTYGMYAAMSAVSISLVPNPSDVILLAETSNKGAKDTYDPVPFSAPYDGFLIGWDTSNVWPTGLTQFVTRLAFYNGSKGPYGQGAIPRHDKGIHMFTVEGSLITALPTSADVRMNQGVPVGQWTTPPSAARPR